MMSKFKVGDRVKRVKGFNAGSEIGHVAVISKIEDANYCGRLWLVFEDGTSGYADSFELIPTTTTTTPSITTGKHYRTRSGNVTGRVARGDIGFDATVDAHVKVFDRAGGAVFGGGDDIVEEWVPKVGDRVVLTADNGDDGEFGAKGDEGRVESTTYSGCHVRFETGSQKGDWWAVHNDDLRPIPTLTIEAGRYYKTRDGRKVGPMEVLSESGGTFYEVVGDGRLWSGEGTGGNLAEGEDLIALWPEPTATATTTAAPVSAQVDAIADEYGSGVVPFVDPSAMIAKALGANDNAPKFKVGDRVVSVENGRTQGMVGTLIQDDHSACPYLVRFDDFENGHGDANREWWLLPCDLQVHSDNVTNLVITVTSEMSDVHADLDEIIRKLKKIKKLQRQVGIDLAA